MSSPDDSPSERQQSNRSQSANRRRFLHGIAATSAFALAGCQGDGNTDTQTNTGDGGTESGDGGDTGTTTDQNQQQLQDVDRTWKSELRTHPDDLQYCPQEPGYPWGETMTSMLVDSGGWRDPKTGERHSLLVDQTEIVSDTEVRVHFNGESGWSNGEPMNGHDIRAIFQFNSIAWFRDPEVIAEQGPDNIDEAIQQIEVDGKTAILKSPDGFFSQFTEEAIVDKVDSYAGQWANRFIYDPVLEKFSDVDDLWSESGRTEVENIIANHDFAWDVQAAVTSGVFKLDEVLDREIRLVPNENHRNSDQINWPEVMNTYYGNENAIWAALGSGNISGIPYLEVPAHVTETLRDNMQEITWNANRGVMFQVNHNHPTLGKPKVRQAIMHSIDRSSLAEIVHRTASEPTGKPGLQSTDAMQYVDDDLRSSMRAYERDIDTAHSLLEEAGLSQEGDGWVTEDGEQLSLTLLASSNGDTQVQETLQSMLSDAGLGAELYTVGGTQYSNRFDDGDYQITPGTWAGQVDSVLTLLYFSTARNRDYKRRYEIYPDEQFTGDFQSNFYQGEFSNFTIEAPPVGEPDGSLQEYQTASMAQAIERGRSDAPLDEYRRKLIWVYNHHLPRIPLTINQGQSFQRKAEWSYPDPENDIWDTFQQPGHMNRGALHADSTN